MVLSGLVSELRVLGFCRALRICIGSLIIRQLHMLASNDCTLEDKRPSGSPYFHLDSTLRLGWLQRALTIGVEEHWA